MTWLLLSHSLSHVRLCDPMDCSLPGSSVHGILQARILEWVAISFSRGSSQPRDQTRISCIAGRFFTVWATRESHCMSILHKILGEVYWHPHLTLKCVKKIRWVNRWAVRCSCKLMSKVLMRVSKWCVYEILSNLLCLEMFHNKILEKIECSNFLLLKIFWPLKISDVKEFSFVVF